MRTSKSIATISYNSNEFLKSKCEDLIESGIIDFAFWIEHAPEEDELKAHKHLYIMPSSVTDTKVLQKAFEEFDDNNDKPLGVITFMPSKFDDWFLYSIHDKAYLASKGQSRKYHYLIDDFSRTDDILFRELINKIDRSKFIGLERVKNAVETGLSFQELVNLGAVPIQLINQYRLAYEMVDTVQRNGRETHTPKKPHNYGGEFMVNEDGEIIPNGWGKSAAKEDLAQSPARSPVVEQIPFD